MSETLKKHQLLLISLTLIAATIIAYEPVRHNGFVTYDDSAYITANPSVTSGLTLQSIVWAFSKPHAGNWHPLTWLSHMLDCQIFGLNPFWHHLVSLGFHVVNALLLLWILNNLTGALWPSAFVAAVFALHPLQVESVAWAAERKTVLSGLFWFLTIAVYIWYTKKPGIGRYIGVFVIYSLCIMTKPVVVTLPFVLLLLDYWPLNRLSIADCRLPNEKRKYFGLICEKIPLFALSAILGIITFVIQRQEGAVASLERIPLGHRIANTFISYIRYTGKMVWPKELAVLYPISIIRATSTAAVTCLILFVILLVLSILIGRRKKYLATGWLWFVGTLIPMIGLVQVGSQAMADRYMYMSMIGLLFIIAWGVKDITDKRLWLKETVTVSAGVILLTLGILTHTQTGYWRNGLTLFEHTLKVTENNPIAENKYGSILMEEGRLKEAEPHLVNAFLMDPLFFEARNDFCKNLIMQNRFDEAIVCCKELLQQGTKTAEIYYNLANLLKMQKKYDEAIQYYNSVLAIKPNYLGIHKEMASIFQDTGRLNEAIEHLNDALPGEPNKMKIYVSLGSLYYQTGDYEGAIKDWSKAVEMGFNNIELFNILARLLATAETVTAQDADKAVELSRGACEQVGYKRPDFLDTLAAAYAAAGRFEDAIATAGKAVIKARQSDQNDLANEIQGRIILYQVHQRYRQTQKTDTLVVP